MIVEAKGDVISLSGSLKHNHWLTIKAACNLLLRTHPEGIIVDCGAVTECTPEGARTFSDAIHYIESCKARIIMVHLPPALTEVIQKVPGVRSSVAIARSMDEARSSLKLGMWDKAPESKSAPIIMVPLLGQEPPRQAIHEASRMGAERGAHIYLVYILEVPRALAITAPLGDEEQFAATLFQKAEELFKKESTVPSRYIKRGRDYSQTLVEAAQHLKADVIILELPPTEETPHSQSQVVDTLLRRRPCQIIISTRPAEETPAEPVSRETKKLPDHYTGSVDHVDH